MPNRMAKVDSLIEQTISNLITTEVEFPGDMLVTVVRAHTSKDLRHAKVWISVFPPKASDTAIKIITGKTRSFEQKLYKKLYLKPLPRLTFLLDTTEENAAEMERLLDRIGKK